MIIVFRIILAKNVIAMAMWPFIILRSRELLDNKRLINHEKIHFRQQLELLLVFFYMWYIIEFLIYLYKYKDAMKAYENISFEKEAYDNENDYSYLKNRNIWSFLNYI